MRMKEKLINREICDIIFDASLSNYNTYKVGGTCFGIAFPTNIDELKELIDFCKEHSLDFKVIGNGSNLVFSDKYYDMLLINLKKFDQIDLYEDTVVAQSGVNLMKLAYRMSRAGLSGLEFATGIPATVGGAVFMNAGAYNNSISDILVSAKVLLPSMEIVEYKNSDFDFSYRFSKLQKNRDIICLEATFKLKKGNVDEIMDLVDNRKMRRVNSQPLEFPSAGSVFRNPSTDVFAGKLIEDLNLKGYKIGGAMISDKHANFVINYDSASGDDIKKLIMFTKEKVKEKYDIDLKIEQEFVD